MLNKQFDSFFLDSLDDLVVRLVGLVLDLPVLRQLLDQAVHALVVLEADRNQKILEISHPHSRLVWGGVLQLDLGLLLPQKSVLVVPEVPDRGNERIRK